MYYNPQARQDWEFYYPGVENWYHVPAPGYHYQYHHHHRPRRKYGPYLVPSDPYLLHSGPSDYFFAGNTFHVQQPHRRTRSNLG